jgi:Arabinose efflux permease
MKEEKVSKWLVALFATACGIIVANLYYAQPIVGIISRDIGLSLDSAGMIVTMTQLGYAFGLVFFVPLADIAENKKLIVGILLIAIMGLVFTIITHNTILFFLATIMIGLGSVSAQILVPLASYLVPDEQRGKMIGNVMSGLLLGIMLARPISSFLSGVMNWRFLFLFSAIQILFLLVVLYKKLPTRHPVQNEKYISIIGSMGRLFIVEETLRRRALYQAILFGVFSMFWTVTPQWLSFHYHLTPQEIALFAFVGVSGAVAAPIMGRLADKGWTNRLTGMAFCMAALSFLMPQLSNKNTMHSLLLLCISAVVLDFSVSGNLVLGQRKIYGLSEEKRGRMNGIFMAIFFLGGAIGSSVGGYIYAHYGWSAASTIGVFLPILGLLYFLTEVYKHKNKE